MKDSPMATLMYTMLMSLDGYIADTQGKFDWARPDEEVHTLVNQLCSRVGTFLLGRRMYEELSAWETLDRSPQPAFIREFAAIWRGADKVVYSRTLSAAPTARTRIERAFTIEAVQKMKAAADRDFFIGGASLAAQALEANLVDVCHFVISPIIVGGGTSAFPDGQRLSLDLRDERRFGNGMVYLRYGVADGRRGN
jgi:dihydrofolate reductase